MWKRNIDIFESFDPFNEKNEPSTKLWDRNIDIFENFDLFNEENELSTKICSLCRSSRLNLVYNDKKQIKFNDWALIFWLTTKESMLTNSWKTEQTQKNLTNWSLRSLLFITLLWLWKRIIETWLNTNKRPIHLIKFDSNNVCLLIDISMTNNMKILDQYRL